MEVRSVEIIQKATQTHKEVKSVKMKLRDMEDKVRRSHMCPIKMKQKQSFKS